MLRQVVVEIAVGLSCDVIVALVRYIWRWLRKPD